MKGQKINDRYQIIKSIGEGGMANVYLAYDTILDRNVAVKVLRGDLAADDKFVRRFQREALSASQLSHPNIVEVYDVGEDGGQYYIVMEYIEGKHLKTLLKKRGKLTTAEVIDIMMQISAGMACAHDSYIIHRDIKPQNIMILENGIVKITDFGVAMALNSTQLTQTNSVMGTVHYLPPEQASGKGSSLKSDIYSMGILMYELLSGTLPYRGENAVEIALKHLKEPMPDIKEILPELPQSIVNVIRKSTAKNPKNRYADAREMHEDLKTVLDDSRLNEPEAILTYPETEFDDTKVTKQIEEEAIKGDGDEIIAKKITEGDLKKQNKLLTRLAIIFTALIVIITTLVVLLPQLSNKGEVKVPDVSNKTEAEAINILQDAGFEISDEKREVTDDEIEEGNVVKTNPAANSKRTKGTEIVLYISTGSSSVVVEDYTGQNYLEVKARLEVLGIYVLQDKRAVDKDAGHKEGEIIDQSIKAGEKLQEKDTITLTVPDIVTEYPDFTDGSFTAADVQAFCDEYGITLKIEYVEDETKNDGVIIHQSRPQGYTVASNTTFSITVIKNENVPTIPGLE